MKYFFVIWCGFFAAFAHSASAQGDGPAHTGLGDLISAGTGCPQSSVYAELAPDSSALTLYLPRWVAELGPLVPISENRKTCNANVSLDYPQGWSFAVVDFEYFGYAALDAGVIGLFSLKTSFQGSASQSSFSGTVSGPFEDNFRLRNGMALPSLFDPQPMPGALVWSPCGAGHRSLNLYNQIRLGSRSRRANARGIFTVDAIDSDPKIKYFLKWRRCA